VAERLRQEGITTIWQLAYADPIHLCIRSGLAFRFVVRSVSQALGWVYLGKGLEFAQVRSLPGAMNLWALARELDAESMATFDAKAEERRQATVNELAGLMGESPLVLERVCKSAAEDASVQFLAAIWQAIDACEKKELGDVEQAKGEALVPVRPR
jgi:hypothetical protein